MLRTFSLAVLFLVFLASCRIAEREGLKPLPDNAPPLAFEEMVGRARVQASNALDAFYVDAWLELEQSAQGLEQTARLLPKSVQIPDLLRTKVEVEAETLRQDAVKLAEAARARNAGQANEAMQRINFRIRQLRQHDALPAVAPPDKK